MKHSTNVGSSNASKAVEAPDNEWCRGLRATKRSSNATNGRVLPKQSTYHTEPSPKIVPHPHDVLCVPGSFANKHPGNVIFRRIVEANMERYRSCHTEHKDLLSRSIVLVIRNQAPPGRFLTRLPGSKDWVDAGDTKALRNIGQALGEGSTDKVYREVVKVKSGSIRQTQKKRNDKDLPRTNVLGQNCKKAMKEPEVFLPPQQATCQTCGPAGQSLELRGENGFHRAFEDESFLHSNDDATLLEVVGLIDDMFGPKCMDDESYMNIFSETECVEAFEFLQDGNGQDGASFGLAPEYRFDMGHGKDGYPMNSIAL